MPDPRPEQLKHCTIRDAARIRGRLKGLKNAPRDRHESILADIDEKIESSKALVEQRKASVPARIEYDDQLPGSARRAEIAGAIRDHQVVIISGETGSGKTTQIPKICLELGRGVTGTIGHTQPRRVAARSVASRIAEELGAPLGTVVGTKIRFADRTTDSTLIKLMTDGVLLAETRSDRNLLAYDTIIIDEAHERSLNIDFLLGYLRQLIDRRRDLRVIITSATIDAERFSEHFADAPVIEVSGRTYPVEVRYAGGPIAGDASMSEHAARQTIDLLRETAGDILVFASGERDIRETAHHLRRLMDMQTNAEILPLYARLSIADQQRVFKHTGGRRVVIATNVAETSLTVPGIRAVVDPGTARISRYNPRSRIQNLDIEAISRASADQRAGRCGRLGPGICVRLYDENDYLRRDEYTPPEIKRTNLASVVLQMASLNLGKPSEFPFVDPPEARAIRDGYETLREIHAIDDEDRLTDLGKRLASLPVDPTVARMILAGDAENALKEIIVLASVMSTQDPRDRPMDRRDDADQAHAEFNVEGSDFLTLLKLWDDIHKQKAKLTRRKFERWCESKFISVRKLREWTEVSVQLRDMARDMSLRFNTKPATPDAIHRALLTGLLHNVAKHKERHEYQGVRGTMFSVFPGSVMFGKTPKWIMAGEVVRTAKLYARTVAKIDPTWIERVGEHLLRKKHAEPKWSERRQEAVIDEKLLLGSLEVVPKREVALAPIDPPLARNIFIHDGILEEGSGTQAEALKHNRALEDEILELESKSRRSDLIADTERKFAFYDARLPDDVWSTKTFNRWIRRAERADPNALRMTRADLLATDPGDDLDALYPADMTMREVSLELDYRNEAGAIDDGVTLRVPIDVLARVDARRGEWLVPGLRREKIELLIRSLPKASRRYFDAGPLAKELATALPPEGDMLDALAATLSARSGVTIHRDEFKLDQLPDHLRLNYRVLGPGNEVLAEGRDLADLRRRVAGSRTAPAGQIADRDLERDDITDWDFGELPERVQIKRAGHTIAAYPALVDLGKTAGIRLFETDSLASHAMPRGLARLYTRHLRDEFKYREKQILALDRIRLHYAPIGPPDEATRDIMLAISGQVFVADDPHVRNHKQFVARLDTGWNRLTDAVHEVGELVDTVLQGYTKLQSVLETKLPDTWQPSLQHVRSQLAELFPPRFIAETPYEWLRCYPRYLRACLRRLERVKTHGVPQDLERAREIDRHRARLAERRHKHELEGIRDPELDRYRWLIEELHVSLFAEQYGTAVPVSPKRLDKAWDAVRP